MKTGTLIGDIVQDCYLDKIIDRLEDRQTPTMQKLHEVVPYVTMYNHVRDLIMLGVEAKFKENKTGKSTRQLWGV